MIECLANSGNECLGGPPLAEKVKNLYNFSLGAGAVLAMGIFIYAGFRYAASGGNSSAIGDARKWMGAALLGLAILLGSYIFIKTINPDLLILKDPTTLQNESQEAPQINITFQGSVTCKASGETCLSPGSQSNCCTNLICTHESGSVNVCGSSPAPSAEPGPPPPPPSGGNGFTDTEISRIRSSCESICGEDLACPDESCCGSVVGDQDEAGSVQCSLSSCSSFGNFCAPLPFQSACADNGGIINDPGGNIHVCTKRQ